MKKNQLPITPILIGVLGVFFVSYAEAGTGILDQVKTSSLSFYTNISSMAMSLLFGLFGVAFAWKAITMVQKRMEVGEMMVEVTKSIIAIGLYVYFIQKGDFLLGTIVDSAKTMASTGAGIPISNLNPDAIMGLGIDLQDSMVKDFNTNTGADSFLGAITNFFPSLMIMIACLIILLSFAMISFNLFLAYAEMYLIIAVAPFMFAMGGTPWTKDNVMKPFQSMIAVSVKIFILALIAKVAIDSAPIWSTLLAQWKIDDWRPMWKVAFQIGTVGVLALLAPKLASAILAGGSSMSAGDALQAGGNVGSMATGAGAAALGVAAATGGGLSKVASALGGNSTAESIGKSAGQGAQNLMNNIGGSGSSGVQPPGSGMSATPSANMPGGPKTGPIAASFGDSASTAPAAPTSSSISTDTSVGNAKAAAATSSAAPATSTGASVTPAAGPSTAAATPATATGDATGASVGGGGASASAPATKSDMQQAISQAMGDMGGKKPSIMDHIASIPSFVPPEGMVSGASVSHVENH